jgi:hypothetical protein
MRRCTVCDSYYPNPRCPACQAPVEDRMTGDGAFGDWHDDDAGPDMDDFLRHEDEQSGSVPPFDNLLRPRIAEYRVGSETVPAGMGGEGVGAGAVGIGESGACAPGGGRCGGHALNLRRVTEAFDAAVEAMELAWARLKYDHGNCRLLTRYVRATRRCARLRATLCELMATGKL